MEKEILETNESTELKKQQKKQPVKVEDTLIVKVKSNFYGKLIYKNQRTGEVTIWKHAGDIQLMSIADLRAMKGNQAGFFQKQLVVITGVEDGNKNAPTVEDICKALVISKYYENYIDPANFRSACAWTVSEIEEKVKMLSSEAKDNLTIALNGFIEDGTLDSISKIKAFEKALGKELYIH